MKRQKLLLGIVLTAAWGMAAPSAVAQAAEQEQQSSAVEQRETQSTFKGLLYKAWNRLRALSPKANAEQTAKGEMVATAGIRGAETTETALKPYWKGDRNNDEQFRQQVEAFNAAQALIEQGRFEQALTALDAFIEQYPDSDWLANARFSKAMALAGAGRSQASAEQFRDFIDRYSEHPLRADAEAVIAELNKAQ